MLLVYDLGSVLAYVAAAVSVVTGLAVIFRGRRASGGIALGLGLLAFGARELFGAVAVHEVFPRPDATRAPREVPGAGIAPRALVMVRRQFRAQQCA